MRISTSSLYNDNIATMNTLQTQLAKTQQQIATGHRLLDPADDPAAAARAAELTQVDSANTQFASNRTSAINTLSLSEAILQSVTSLLQDVRDTAMSAGDPLLTDAGRKAMAMDVQARLDELVGLSNSTDGKGNYLFSGAQGKVQPFVDTGGGVVYQGDDVQRKVQAAALRQISTTDSGADVFMRIRNGNGIFQTAQAAGNTGNATIGKGTLLDPTQYTGQSYQVVFTGANNYDIKDVPGGITLISGAYVSGQAITYSGIQFNIQGAPVGGDKFDIVPSGNQSLFTTLNNFIATLNASIPSTNAMNSAAYRQGLADATAALDQGLSNVLGVRATMGARLNELDALQSSGMELGTQYKQSLSKIQDTDYNKAVTDLNLQQMMLQASQQSFAKVSKMSLFDYL